MRRVGVVPVRALFSRYCSLFSNRLPGYDTRLETPLKSVNTLPTKINELLGSKVEDHLKPLCVVLDRQLKVVEWSGNNAYYGYNNLELATDAATLFPFLVGLQLKGSITLPMVATNNGRATDIEIIEDTPHFFLLFVDATEKHVRQRELQQKANELKLLNHRLTKLTRELKTARDELDIKRQQAEEASRAKSRFISGMSHEFRTPLTSILGYVDLFKDHGLDKKEILKHLPALERGAKYLLSLIDNLLDHSRLETRDIVIYPVPTDLRSLSDDLVLIFKPLTNKKKLTFNINLKHLPAQVVLDNIRLRQILINLISNAVKFTKKGGVTVEFEWYDDYLLINVSDTGPGISKHDQDKIFLPFHRLANDEITGSGLGLSISKRLVELMEGVLSVESTEGMGSRFCIQLPAKSISKIDSKQSLAKKANESSAITGAIKVRILLAEDNEDIINLIKLFLTDVGYELLTASDGEQAVEVAICSEPDLILMDLNLPSLDGLAATKRLRELHFAKPILALTASPSETDRQRALDAGL